MTTAARQSKELASRAHIRHALAVERARAMVAMIGRFADQVWERVQAKIDAGKDPAGAIEAFVRELPRVMEKAFRDHARWAWARTEEMWSVLTPVQRARIKRRTITVREDDIAKAPRGQFDFSGDQVKVFTPPDADKIAAWVSNPGWFNGREMSWQDRLEMQSRRIADKEELSRTLTRLYADGANVAEIARAIRPAVDNIKASAQRIARTESLRIAEEAQRESYAQVDDLIAGMQIWATLDDRTRPEHAARNGTIYPKDACPIVPDEPNCRCFTAPVLRDDAEIIKADVGGRPAGNLTVVNGTVQDLDTWSAWFDAQSPARQRGVIGPDRFEALDGKVSGRVRWAHVVDDAGYMNTAEQLRAADAEALNARVSASAPAAATTAIADQTEVVKADVPETSPLGRILNRTDADGKPTGLPLDALNAARMKSASEPDAETIAATPNTAGIPPAKVPEYVARAAVEVNNTVSGRAIAAALSRMTPRQLASAAGARKMFRIVQHPAVVHDPSTIEYWRSRAQLDAPALAR
ncbi:MAG: minor capsid protein [Planctomycetes bacterium]|nr:minor capsid protein [Planctomycetota bacterium]